MLLGLDFDNTIAGYDWAFTNAARRRFYVSKTAIYSKREIKEITRSLSNGEEKWKALQGEVYGRGMKNAI